MIEAGNGVHSSIAEYIKNEENSILKMAMEQMNIQVFAYDGSRRRLHFLGNPSKEPPFAWKETECLLEEFLTAGFMDDSDTAAFQNLFDAVEQGQQSASARIRFWADKEELWFQVRLTRCCCGEAGLEVAIGTMQDISSRVKIENRYTNEKQYRLAMLADSRRVYEINVTKDRFIKLQSIQDSTDGRFWQPYTKTMNQMRETLVYQEDWETFMQIADREHLLSGFLGGKQEFYCEYRVVDEGGQTTWSSSATHLLKDPISDDIKGFIYIKDIDQQKKQQLELAHEAECDALTGIYNRRTAEKLIKRILEDAAEGDIYGFLTIDLDDFKLVNDTFGHSKGDQLLRQAAEEISMAVRERDIVARIGGDEFIVFLYQDVNQKNVEQIANRINLTVSNIRLKEGDKFRPTASIGIAIYPSGGRTFKELYEHSDQALYQVKQHGKNHIEFYVS